MTVSPRIRVLAFALLAIVALACGINVGSPPDATPGPTRPPGQGQPASPGKSIDPNEFATDLQGAVTSAEEYWAGKVRNFRPIRQIVPYRENGEIACGEQPIPSNNAVYCPPGDFIAYDVDWAARAFNQIGDAFLFFLLGHEYAHAIQVRLGIQYRYTIDQELQADCMAGAYLGDSIRSGSITIEEGDIEELRAGLIAVGDPEGQPWFEEGSHGSAEQRMSAFFNGYERSVSACNLT